MTKLHHTLRNNLRIHRRLRAQACPTVSDRPMYRHCMAVARAQGLNRIEALQFTAETRSYYF